MGKLPQSLDTLKSAVASGQVDPSDLGRNAGEDDVGPPGLIFGSYGEVLMGSPTNFERAG